MAIKQELIYAATSAPYRGLIKRLTPSAWNSARYYLTLDEWLLQEIEHNGTETTRTFLLLVAEAL